MIKPMLSANFDIDKARYPLYGSIKIDGIRAILYNGRFWSRSGKLLPNLFLQTWARTFDEQLSTHYCAFDGELVTTVPNDPKCFNKTQSDIMTMNGVPEFTYYVFDIIPVLEHHKTDPDNIKGYEYRLKTLHGIAQLPFLVNTRFSVLDQTLLMSQGEVEQFEETCVTDGLEGIMLRDPLGGYKHGRSTMNEQYLMKMKRFVDTEAKIIGFEELLSNNNEPDSDAFGNTERSHHKENMIPSNTLGSFIVESPLWDKPFHVGSGFTAAQRECYWQLRNDLIGSTITFKYQAHGTKDVPRMPIFKGFRQEE